MLSNITSNPQKEISPRQSLYQEGDQVYLYGDRNYTGKLIRPLERTYPQKWTVELDRGGYEAVNLSNLCLIDSPSKDKIPFSDEPEPTISELQQEIIALKRSVQQLKQENEIIKKDLVQAKQIIRRAKDIAPIIRMSLKRVLRLAHEACMDVQRTVGGWILKMGDKARKFRRLADIWDILSQDEFVLSEIFAEDKLIAVELILPPKRLVKAIPAAKQTFPLLRREEVLRRRRMGLPKCC